MALKYVQIETTTFCSHRCTFCPVSTAERPPETMAMDTLDRILDGLRGRPVERVYINGFNEPTRDPHLAERVRRIRAAGNFEIFLNTNGSGLRPELIDELIAAGVNSVVVNLSTVDEAEFRATRGAHGIARILGHLDCLFEKGKAAGVAVEILVLGNLDQAHCDTVLAVEKRFARHSPAIVICPIKEYAGDPRRRSGVHNRSLRGCGQQDRPNRWLHFTANGEAIFCCHDYRSEYVIGDVQAQDVESILRGEELARFRRWTEGVEVAPDDFLCRRCPAAITDEDFVGYLKRTCCEVCAVRDRFDWERSCGRCAVQGLIEENRRGPSRD
jgi:radical SAM protein with 4Fe4S-binding SPASM domain